MVRKAGGEDFLSKKEDDIVCVGNWWLTEKQWMV